MNGLLKRLNLQRGVPLFVVFSLQFLATLAAFCAVTTVLLLGQRLIISNAVHDSVSDILNHLAALVSRPLTQHARDTDALVAHLFVARALLPGPTEVRGSYGFNISTSDFDDAVPFNYSFLVNGWGSFYVGLFASASAGAAYEDVCIDIAWNASIGKFECSRGSVVESGCAADFGGYCYGGRDRSYLDINVQSPINFSSTPPPVLPPENDSYTYYEQTASLDDYNYVRSIWNLSSSTSSPSVAAWSSVYTWYSDMFITRVRCLQLRQKLHEAGYEFSGDPLPQTAEAVPASSLPGISCVHAVSMDINIAFVNRLLQVTLPSDIQGTTTVIERRSMAILCSTAPQLPRICTNGTKLCSALGTGVAVIDLGIAMNSRDSACNNGRSENCSLKIDTNALDDSVILGTKVFPTDLTDDTAMVLLLIVSLDRSYFYSVGDAQLRTAVTTACVTVVAVLLVTVTIALSVSRSVRSLLQNFAFASVLENDKVVADQSLIRELGDLHRRFQFLNERLTMAKAFLPETAIQSAGALGPVGGHNGMLDEDSSTTHSADSARAAGQTQHVAAADEVALTNIAPTDHASNPFVPEALFPEMELAEAVNANPDEMFLTNNRRSTVEGSTAGGTADRRSESAFVDISHVNNASVVNTSAQSTTKPQSPPKLDRSTTVRSLLGSSAYRWAPRRVAVLMANLWDFERMITVQPDVARRVHAWVLQQLVASVKEHNGVVDSFHGDHFIATFNASVDCLQPVPRAVDAMLRVLTAVRVELPKQQEHETSTATMTTATAAEVRRTLCGVSFGLSESLAYCGNMGTSTMQRFSVIGRCVNEAHALLMYCRVDRLTNCISSSALKALQQLPYSRQYLVQHVTFAKLPRAEKGTLFSLVLGKRDAGVWRAGHTNDGDALSVETTPGLCMPTSLITRRRPHLVPSEQPSHDGHQNARVFRDRRHGQADGTQQQHLSQLPPFTTRVVQHINEALEAFADGNHALARHHAQKVPPPYDYWLLRRELIRRSE